MHTIVESRWVARGKQGILRLMDVAIDQHQDGHFVIIIKSLIHIFDLDATNEMPSNQTRPSINYPPPIMHFQCCPSNCFFSHGWRAFVCWFAFCPETIRYRNPHASVVHSPAQGISHWLTKQSNRAMIGIDCSCSKVCQMN